MKHNIGVDIDGVLTDEGNENNNIWYQKLNEYFDKKIERKKDVFDFTIAYDLSKEVIDDFLKKNIENIYSSVKPIKGARETLLKLKKLGFNIYLITARNPKFRPLTKNWLKRHDIPYTKLIHEENKAPLASKKNIKLFIEDNKENAKQLIEHGISVILVNKYHNQNIEANKKLHRVNDWLKVREYIFEFYNID